MAEQTEVKKIFQKADHEESKEKQGYEDGGEVTLTCSNCDKPLVVILRSRPNEKLGKNPLSWKMKANCCYCGDASFVKTIIGGFHYKGYDTPHPNGNPEDVVPHVNVINSRTEDDCIIFDTEKIL